MKKIYFFYFLFLMGLFGIQALAWASQAELPKTPSAVRKTALRTLFLNNVQIITAGEDVRLVLFSDDVFYKDSVHIRDASPQLLQTVIQFINTYRVVSLTVSVYTDDIGPNDKNKKLALSRQQARFLVDFLERGGVDARLLSGVGYGAQHFVDDNRTPVGRWNNRRVEIGFRYVNRD